MHSNENQPFDVTNNGITTLNPKRNKSYVIVLNDRLSKELEAYKLLWDVETSEALSRILTEYRKALLLKRD